MISFTKDAISHRMLKNALSFWNLKNAEELDPVVRLMLEALSVELYQLSTENQNTHTRTLDRVAQMLAPAYATCPVPAHALMHAQSIEASEVLYPTQHFSCQKKDIPDENTGVIKQVEIFFTTVKPVRLFDIKPAVLFTGNYGFKVGESLQKESSMPWNMVQMKQQNSIWLGLLTSQPKLSVNGMPLYFDFKMSANDQVQLALRMLPFIKCYYGDREVAFTHGLQYAPDKKATDTSMIANLHPLYQIEEDVVTLYEKYFITLTDENLLWTNDKASSSPFADGSAEQLKAQELNQQKLHWIRLEFPHSVSPDLLDNLEIHTNIFPCVNRRLAETKYSLKQYSRIVPLRTANHHEQFLDIESVSDNVQEYSATQFNHSNNEQSQGLFALLQGGIEKFDTRNAKEHITNLLELLRSESASFSAYGYDFVASSLKELQQKMALIEQKTSSLTKSGSETDYYLLVQPTQGQETIFTNYWCTTGAFGNGLRSDTKLNAVQHTVAKSNTVFLVQQTNGGKNRLKADDRLSAFKYSMLSHNSIITKQDIISFCELQLGKSARTIAVDKGYEWDNMHQQNYRRTIDVKITPEAPVNKEDWQLTCERLQAQLQSRSSMGSYYRVILTT